MPDAWMGPLELLLVFGIVIGLALRELIHLRRDNEAARREARNSEAPPSAR
jgi:hypothetical protein